MQRNWRTISGFRHVGATGKTRGINGELKLYVDDPYLEAVVQSRFLFLDLNGNKVPLETESIRELQDLLIKFVGIDDPTAATKWTSLEVFLPLDELTSPIPESEISTLEYEALIGYIISDDQLGEIGEIVEIREYPQQEMAVLNHQGREVLVPLNAVFIVRIARDQRKVFMDLPAGILEI